MSGVPCHFYDGQTSKRRDATLTITVDGDLVIAVDGMDSRRLHRLPEVRIPTRIVDTPRHIHLPDGALCEVRDNDALDAMQAQAEHGSQPPGQRFARLVHKLDTTWRGAAAALAVTALILYSFTEWGAPAVATVVVAATPPEVEAIIGDNLLTLFLQLDFLDPSELEQNRRNELLAAFETMRVDAGVEATDLQFYASGDGRRGTGGGLGPNAFALPGGTVVVTDELVRLAEKDEEIIAVLAHELGHVEGRHVLRRLAQTSSMFVLWTAFTGDASVAALSILGPEQLLAQRYSRNFERDADRFAADYLLSAGIPPTRLGDILQRLEGSHGGAGIPNWLASHPGTEERARNAGEAAERARSGAAAPE